MPVLRSLAIAALLLLGAFVTGGPARSALILQDDPVFGPNSLVLDTSTGLEWLNLRSSINTSPADVIAGFQPGGEFEGFRYATLEEFGLLTTDFFGQTICCTFSLDLTKTIDFANLFGPTSGTNDLPQLSGFFNPFPELEGETTICTNRFFYQLNDSPGLSGVYEQDCGATTAVGPQPFMGSYLVRAGAGVPIPEPSSITLVCAGLLLALLTRARKAWREPAHEW
jgi:hypothetical protein